MEKECAMCKVCEERVVTEGVEATSLFIKKTRIDPNTRLARKREGRGAILNGDAADMLRRSAANSPQPDTELCEVARALKDLGV